MESIQKFLSKKDVSDILGVSLPTINRRIADSTIPHISLDRVFSSQLSFSTSWRRKPSPGKRFNYGRREQHQSGLLCRYNSIPRQDLRELTRLWFSRFYADLP
jgi:hypothetical protein